MIIEKKNDLRQNTIGPVDLDEPVKYLKLRGNDTKEEQTIGK